MASENEKPELGGDDVAPEAAADAQPEGGARDFTKIDLDDPPAKVVDANEAATVEGSGDKRVVAIDAGKPDAPLSADPQNGRGSQDLSKQPANNVHATAPAEARRLEPKSGWVRHMIAILALSAVILANMNRQSFNQALVSMTKVHHKAEPVTASPVAEPTGTTQHYEPTTTTQEAAILQDGSEADDAFDWSSKQIGMLQAAFSWGYTPFMIPGGRLCEIYGAKWIIFMSGFGSALCCIFSPFLAETDYRLLVVSRIIMGLSQTGVSPALYALLTRWLSPEEASVYLPLTKVAVQLGFVAGSLVSGFFAWRATFYIVGTIGVLWSVGWATVVSSEPAGHKFISRQEVAYIHQTIGKTKADPEDGDKKKNKSAPWLGIITNPIVLAFMFTKFTVKLSTDSQTIQLPMYLRNIFHVSKELNGTLSAINFAIQGIFTGLIAWAAKEFVVRQTFGLTKTGVRRLFQGINNFGMAFAFILITFNMDSLNMVCCAVVLLSVSSMFGSGGEMLTPIDLTLEYSASIMAVANSFANLSGVILPPLVSTVLGDEPDSSARWDAVWLIVAGIITLGGFLYTCLVKAEIQDFEKCPKEKGEADIVKPIEAIELQSK